ncbi:hypothetical protein [Enterobacter kobei]|uniref:hypothetical protein n=1 Tax=Enterobacter kobei TaxID=208224 RepID=UPI00159EED86|nr:hypothetical protein [Enterobacter kobei]
MINREFTKEQLIEWTNSLIEETHSEISISRTYAHAESYRAQLALLKIALASLEAEPIGFAFADDVDLMRKKNKIGGMLTVRHHGEVALFTAPPAAASVPDKATSGNIEILASTFAPRGVTYQWDRDECNAAADSWNACRAAMLQSFGNYEQLNSSVIPDGWVMVPAEPTEDMIIQGFESEPDESFSDEKEWEAYDAMSGCQQAAHRAKLCWAAMIAAAPKRENI